MTVFLDKLLPLFVFPVGLTILAGIAAIVLSLTGFGRLSRTILAAGVALLWIASMPLFANWLTATLESKYPPTPIDSLPQADVAIVLGGAVGQPLPPRLTADASDAVDRVLHAARIYRAGKVDAILVSGGNLPWRIATKPEAELIADLLVELGVPLQVIVLETASRNSRENAVNSAAVMAERGWQKALLVTSAAHMPRALAVFRKAGIEATPASTDIRVTYPIYESFLDLLPNADALALTTNATKEWLGLLVYRLRGWT